MIYIILVIYFLIGLYVAVNIDLYDSNFYIGDIPIFLLMLLISPMFALYYLAQGLFLKSICSFKRIYFKLRRLIK